MIRRQDTRDFIEDVEWLVTAGETHAEAVAARVGSTNPEALKRRLQRAHRNDLIYRIAGFTAEGRTR